MPPIRKFAKYIDEDQKDVFDLWMTGPMKPITKYGGMPKADRLRIGLIGSASHYLQRVSFPMFERTSNMQ